MTPERHRRLMDLFDEVCDLGETARLARIGALRAEDHELAEELVALLRADDDADGHRAIDAAAAGLAGDLTLATASRPRPRDLPEHIGRYRVVRVVGEGGMGIVYEAEQELPQRKVAVKVIRGHLATASLRKRFELETHILARLGHPGICRIYEAAADEESCFFAMELVEGTPLTGFAETRRLPTRARLELLARVCDAVHHAHVKGVIHLDLKPANILVTDDGQPKVLDFGIARVVDPDCALTGMTLTGQILGTPAYMSPEQTALSADLLDARSDVYTLGAIGYELLAGRLPHDIRGLAVPEIILRIRENDPAPLAATRPDLRGDVEIILGKALAKDPEVRYQSAAALADDLRRHLRDEPIEARPPTAAYQLRMFARRNRALVFALAGLGATLVAGTLVSGLLATRAERARAALAVRTDALTVLEARASLLEDPTRAAARLKTLSTHGAWDEALAVAREAAALGVARDLLRGHDGEVHAAAFAPSGELLATASYDGSLRLWDLGRARARAVELGRELHLVAFAPGGALAVAGKSGTLALVDPAGGEARALGGHEGWVNALAWAPGGLFLASGADDGTIRTWRGDGQPLAVLGGHGAGVNDAVFSPDGARVASAGIDGTVRVHATTGEELAVLRGHDDEVDNVVFLPDGLALASAGRDGKVILWRPEPRVLEDSGEEMKHIVTAGGVLAWAGRGGAVRVLSPGDAGPRVLARHPGVVRALAFSPDGALLASAGDDRTVRLTAVASGDGVVLLGHEGRVRQLAFSPDGRLLASVADDGTARVWPAGAPLASSGRRVAASVTGEVAVAGADRAIRLRDAAGRARLLLGHTDEIYQLAFSPRGDRLASASRDRTVRLWDVAGGGVTVLPSPARAVRLAFAEGQLAAGNGTGAISVWDLETLAERTLVGHDDRVNDLRFLPGARALVSGGEDGTVRLWDEAGGRVLLSLTERVTSVAVSPDGARVAAGSGDATVRVVALGGGEERLVGHRGEVTAVAYSPDGLLLASGGVDRTVRLWRDGLGVAVFAGPAGAVVVVAFTPNGEGVVAGAADGTLRLFRIDGGASRILARGHGPVIDATLCPDGSAAVVNDEDGLRLVPTGPPGREPEVRRLLDEMTRGVLDEAGVLRSPSW